MNRPDTEPGLVYEFSRRQERANVIIHIIGILFGVGAIPFLFIMARDQHAGYIISIIIYAFCFLLLFTSSAMYHASKRYKVKRFFKKLDRISIYFLIAGTYTAIIRYYLFDGTGIVLLSVLWGLVVVGIFFELFFPGKFNLISVLFYLVMGLIFVFVPNHFFSSMPTQVMALVLCGVGLYCFGVIFYLWQKWPYHHAIWHFFVLGGGIVHFVAILVTVA